MGQKRKRRFTDPREGEIEEFKKFLGPDVASRYTDAQLAGLRRDLHLMARLLLDIWIEKKGMKRLPEDEEG